MYLTRLALIACPAILASFLLVNVPAEANTTPDLMQSNKMQLTAVDHAVIIAVAPQSNRPLFPTGCSCGLCSKPEDLLQGQLPAF